MQLDIDVQKKQGKFPFPGPILPQRLTGLACLVPRGAASRPLMHLLAGLRSPDSGHIRLDDTVLFDSGAKINLPPDQRRVGVVFQHSHLFSPIMSVPEKSLLWMEEDRPEERRIDAETISKCSISAICSIEG